jgi:hypothetical protein
VPRLPPLCARYVAKIALRLKAMTGPAKGPEVGLSIISADLKRDVMVEIDFARASRLKAHLTGTVEALPDPSAFSRADVAPGHHAAACC